MCATPDSLSAWAESSIARLRGRKFSFLFYFKPISRFLIGSEMLAYHQSFFFDRVKPLLYAYTSIYPYHQTISVTFGFCNIKILNRSETCLTVEVRSSAKSVFMDVLPFLRWIIIIWCIPGNGWNMVFLFCLPWIIIIITCPKPNVKGYLFIIIQILYSCPFKVFFLTKSIEFKKTCTIYGFSKCL